MIRGLLVFGCGLLFALGLGLSGMTRADVVLGFLDVSGAWRPDLVLVMAAAVVTYGVGWRLAGSRPWLAAAFSGPTPGRVDGRLVAGAAIFGVGWGLSGLCPGPALVSLAAPSLPTLAFVLAMTAGMVLVGLADRRR